MAPAAARRLASALSLAAALGLARPGASAAPAVGAGAATPGGPAVACLADVNLAGRLAEWPELTLAAGDAARAVLAPDDAAALEAAVAEAFATPRLRAAVERGFTAPAPVLAGCLAFGASPLGQVLRADRAQAARSDVLVDAPFYLADLVAVRVGRPRLAMLGRLEGALGLSRDVMTVARGVAVAVAGASAELRCLGPAEARREVHAARARVEGMRGAVASRVRAGLGFVHRGRATRELGRYANTAAGELRPIYEELGAGIEAAVAEAEAALRAQLAPRIAARCTAAGAP
jgi:hypothetical protein